VLEGVIQKDNIRSFVFRQRQQFVYASPAATVHGNKRTGKFPPELVSLVPYNPGGGRFSG